MASKHGQLFVFEGPCGVGKTTLSRAFALQLEGQGRQCQHISCLSRRTGSLGDIIHRLQHDAKSLGVGRINPQSLQILQVAGHVEVICEQVQPAIEDGVDVVLDRYWWSTWVDGILRGVSKRLLRSILRPELDAWAGLQPTVLVLLDRPDISKTTRDAASEYAKVATQECEKYPVTHVVNNCDVAEVLAGIDQQINGIKHARDGDSAPSLWEPTSAAPTVFSKLSPAKSSVVFDTYWRFAAARQEMFFKRITGEPPPWTVDSVLQTYKFTNAYRASDRVSQYLIRNVLYNNRDQDPNEVFFRTLLFKLFNKIETWQLIERKLGDVSWGEYSYDKYDRVLGRARAQGIRLYSAAYIMPSGRGAYGYKRKYRTHLKLLESMMQDDLPARIADASNMTESFALLRAYPTIGDFLAYQYATDLNYSTLTDFPEDGFVVAGPGAKDGIRKCFSEMGGLKDSDLIRLMMDRQEEEFSRLNLRFRSLWGRRLQLIDCQNLFCEVGKYARVAHPDVAGVSGRTRIKQRFRANVSPLAVWYPPKWGINDKVEDSITHVSVI